MELLDGKKIAQEIKDKLKEKINKGIKAKLAVVSVGNDPASRVYIGMKQKACKEVGIGFIHKKIDKEAAISSLKGGDCLVTRVIKTLNDDEKITGILVQLPLPKEINQRKIFELIDPKKDVDCLTPSNVGRLNLGYGKLAPCTAKGCIRLLKKYGIEIAGKKVVVVGRSDIVGKPVAQLLLNEDATVTICHSKTKNLSGEVERAEILIAAVGKALLIKESMIKEGAVVIDVGINRINGKLKGDVDFDNVKDKVSFITPVPGGVGPMTVAELMNNTVFLASRKYF